LEYETKKMCGLRYTCLGPPWLPRSQKTGATTEEQRTVAIRRIKEQLLQMQLIAQDRISNSVSSVTT